MTKSGLRLGIRAGGIAMAILAANVAPGLAASAVAATAHAAPSTPHSTFFAGYAGHSSTVTSETAVFTLSQITCTAKNQAVAVGLLAFNSAGATSGGGVLDLCSSGTPQYIATALVGGVYTGLPMAVKPGDKIRVSVSVGASKTKITVSDLNTHVSKTATDKKASLTGFNMGILGDFVGGTLQGVPSFASIPFTKARVNGATLGTLNPTRVNRVSSGGVLQVATGPLDATGTTWTETFKHS